MSDYYSMSADQAIAVLDDYVVDSRDVDAAIEALADYAATGEYDVEYNALVAFKDEAEPMTSEWSYGAFFIREDYFTDYARELAADIGAVDPDAEWPIRHIDWDAAADELRNDYSEVGVDGTYWLVRD